MLISELQKQLEYIKTYYGDGHVLMASSEDGEQSISFFQEGNHLFIKLKRLFLNKTNTAQ